MVIVILQNDMELWTGGIYYWNLVTKSTQS